MKKSRKLTYLKLPHLWNQQSFLDYCIYEQDCKVQQRQKEEKDHNSLQICDRIQRSSYQAQEKMSSEEYERATVPKI